MIKRGKYGRYIPRLLAISDFVVLNVAFAITVALNPATDDIRTRLAWLLLNVANLPVARWLVSLRSERSLQIDRMIRSTLLGVGGHALLFITLMSLMGLERVPWKVYVEMYSLLGVMTLMWRVATQMALKSYRRNGRNYSNVVIVGCRATAERLYKEMKSDPGFGYAVQGFFDIYCPPDFPYKHLYRGNIDDLAEFVRSHRTDEIYYTISGEDEAAVQLTVGICDAMMIKFWFVPQISPYLTRNFRQGVIGAIPVMGVMNNPLENPLNSILKRCFDIVFSSVFLLFSPLVFIPVAVAIKISSPGPVFFRQKRTGYMGHEFTCWKFRTMRVNRDADSCQATRHDPRKTRLGDFLRRSSIDELPQFLNVLLGDMSVVGPRPHMLKHTEDYRRLIGKYMVRHLIKPGITGWAQVRGYRGQTEELWQMERRIEHDIWYIEHWSFLLDMKIIARTVINAFKNDENAF